MKTFGQAKWIWLEKDCKPDSYGEFFDEFIWEGGKVICRLSCDSDYTLYINGKFVANNQYGDFEWYKSYDSVDISSYLNKGKNTIAVLVWYFGVDSQRYLKAQAGLIFEILQGENNLLSSDEFTRARYSKAYFSGRQKLVTHQLGFSFSYDATKEDDWKTSGNAMQKAVVVEKSCKFIPRPISKLKLSEVNGKVLLNKGNYYLVDLGEETVGSANFSFFSNTEQRIRVDWGEDLQNGHVRRLIDNRDFSFDYVAKKGDNIFTNYMLRLGCRYLEIYAEQPIELRYAGLISQEYPVNEKKVVLPDKVEQRIYDTCVNTLKLCMLEHYVDTPWREQCLYVYDSRNQALCGYQVFDDGNAEYVRANLKLMSQDRRQDGLLAICYPCGMDLTIPSFSLYYFLLIKEYLEHTGDLTLAEEVYDKLISVLNVFISNRKDGLVLKFEGKNHWNFYDWSLYLDGALHDTEKATPDLMINVLFVLALQSLSEIDKKLGKNFAYEEMLKESKTQTRKAFYNAEDGLFSMTKNKKEYTVLGNSLAILVGLTTKIESEDICKKIAKSELSDCSLSMKCFKYDALLTTDKEKWSNNVRNEIKKDYAKMTENGTSVWETIDGANAFDNAGSLCHGWSAIPILYLSVLR